MDNQKYAIGMRIIDSEGFKGTIGYIGSVAAAKEKSDVWLGIEWDNSLRGKHDGSCADASGNFHRYFLCPMGYGSFIKPNKVKLGRTLTEALLERYVTMDAPEVAPQDMLSEGFVMTSKGNLKQIELVGEKKIRQYQQLSVVTKVTLRNDTIAFAGNDIKTYAEHLVELDLQDNLLSDWNEIAAIAKEIPKLQALHLHSNKIIMALTITSIPRDSFSQLKILALNNCSLQSFSTILLLEPLLPSLTELYLASNLFLDFPLSSKVVISPVATTTTTTTTTIITIENNEVDEKSNSNIDGTVFRQPDSTMTEIQNDESVIPGFLNLKILDLSNCGLNSWAQIHTLRIFPNLTELKLDGNPLDNIWKVTSPEFSQCCLITLASSSISSWKDIDSLFSYPKLTSLRLAHIPLFQGKSASEVRSEIISRLPQLTYFNGSGISARERMDAERSYLRRTRRELSLIESNNNNNNNQMTEKEKEEKMRQFYSEHPTLKTIEEKYYYDLVNAANSMNTFGGSLAAEMITIKIYNVSTSGNVTADPITKRLPASLLISKLKFMIKQLFQVGIQEQVLSYRTHKDALPVLLDDNDATLLYSGITDGSDIFVNSLE